MFIFIKTKKKKNNAFLLYAKINWFVENWSTISILTDLATFSVAILDDLPKVSAKLQKEGVDTKELDTFVEKARREVGKRTAESSRSLKRLLTNEDYKRI